MKKDGRQLELPLSRKPNLRVIKGDGARPPERLKSRDAVARVLLEAGADLLLRRISSDRAEAIDALVDDILNLFDKVDRQPQLTAVLETRLEELESLMRDTRASRGRRASARVT